MKSWKTFLMGSVGAIGLILVQIGHGLDDNPQTTTNWDIVMKLIGGLLAAGGIFGNGFFGRDDNVNDESVGAGRTDD